MEGVTGGGGGGASLFPPTELGGVKEGPREGRPESDEGVLEWGGSRGGREVFESEGVE